MKQILSLLLLLAATMFSTALHAQGHFDWVKSYQGAGLEGGGSSEEIIDHDIDSQGNVYIIGHFSPGANIDGISLLPMTPYGPQTRTKSVVIAKFSPAGDLLWHKAVHANYRNPSRAIGIKCMGDTSIVCLFDFVMPSAFNAYIYFLDSLYEYPASALWDNQTVSIGCLTAFVRFSPSGNVQERHILTISYTDSLGNDIRSNYNRESFFNHAIAEQKFTIDNQGNIILQRIVTDKIYLRCDTYPEQGIEASVTNGLIGGVKFLVDDCNHQLILQNVAPTKYGNHQLIKFSPHFDSILADNYVLSLPPDCDIDIHSSNIYSLTTDCRGNIYYSWEIYPMDWNYYTVNLQNGPGMVLNMVPANPHKGFCVQYSNMLTPMHLLQFDHVIADSSIWMVSTIANVSFDEDSNIVILANLDKVASGSRPNNYFLYDTMRIETELNTLCFFRLDSTWRVITYGTSANTLTGPSLNNTIVAKNNRIIAQVRYFQTLQTIDSTYSTNAFSHGLLTWDYDGHPISFIDYHDNSQSTVTNGVCLHDSILYLSGEICGGSFQNINIPFDGKSAYLAKYIDTDLMTPYVYKDTTGNGGGNGGNGGDTNDVRIVMAEDGNAFVAYPNPFRQRVNVEYSGQQPITAAYLTDIMGRTEQVELSATAPGRYTLDLTARPQAAYLLTLVTQDGHRHTVRLLKQSEIFGN